MYNYYQQPPNQIVGRLVMETALKFVVDPGVIQSI